MNKNSSDNYLPKSDPGNAISNRQNWKLLHNENMQNLFFWKSQGHKRHLVLRVHI